MKKHHWHAFWHEKLFEKHPQPHCQTRPKSRLATWCDHVFERNYFKKKLLFLLF
jgi:hypothetical protein